MRHPRAVILCLALGACVSDGSASVGPGGAQLEPTYGAIVGGDVGTVWVATKATLARLGRSFSADEQALIARTDYAGAEVAVRLQPYDGRRTIVRVSARRDGAEDLAVADRVQLEIQRALLR